MTRRTLFIAALLALAPALGWLAGRLTRAPEPPPPTARTNRSPAHPLRIDGAPADRSDEPAAIAPADQEAATSDIPPDDAPRSEDPDAAAWSDLVETGTAASSENATTGSILRDARFRAATARWRGRFATERPDGTGEITHPEAVARILDELLRSSHPLDGDQRAVLAKAIADYERERAARTSGYDDATPRLERIVDEVDAKRRFLDNALEALDDAQRRRLRELAPNGAELPPLLSPLLMAEIRKTPLPTSDAAALSSLLADDLADDLPLARYMATRLADTYLQDLGELLDADAAASLSPIDQALIAGRARIELLHALLSLPELSPPLREQLLSSEEWDVPVARE